MDVLDGLRQDHREVEGLFDKFESLGERAFMSKARTVAKLIRALGEHAEVEETIVYPALRHAGTEEDMVLESYEEHHLVHVMLEELDELDAESESFDAKVNVLKDLVQRHVEEEENILFPAARRALGRAKLEELGGRVAAARKDYERRHRGDVARVTFSRAARRRART